jgi:phage virion morphogenesis protein
MPARITIEYSAGDIIARMQQLHDRLGGDGLRPALREIGEALAESTRRRFATSTAPDGSRWAPNAQTTYLGMLGSKDTGKDGRLNKRGSTKVMNKKPLVASGLLADSITWQLTDNGVEIGTNRIYAGTHQFGASRGQYGTTSRGAPIPWGNIPARPFLGLSAADELNHPFGTTHCPPNGWGCRCRVVAVRAPAEGDATEPPEGWNAINEATGTPAGIDKGWAYAPGGGWFPDLDRYPTEHARQMVADNLRDGVFERWVARIDATVSKVRQDYPDLSGPKLSAELRRRLGAEEIYPVAVLSKTLREGLSVTTQTVRLSDYDLIKQAVSRAGQNFDAIRYFNVQRVLDEARLVVMENAQMTIFASDATGTWYAAILQQTRSGKGVFLKSFRRSSEKDARLQAKKGEILKSDL